jgi:hypothetical protein
MSRKPSIFGWSAGPGGSEWYRLTLPLSTLASLHGWDAAVGTGYPSDRVGSPPDVVVVQRPMNAVTMRTMRHWSRKSACLLAVDLDDDFWTIPPDNPAHRMMQPELLMRLETCLAMADVVTVSTNYLAEKVSQHTSAPIRVVGNFVPAALVDRVLPPLRGHKVVVGWAGSPTHRGDWMVNADGIRAALDYSNKIDFHIVGADYSAEVAGTLRALRHTPFQRDIADYYNALDFNIALAPLAPTEFNRSKSDIRILESAAIGAVPVMTNWGPYAKVTGRHTSKTEHWQHHVGALVSAPQELHDERKAWRNWARERTIEANAHRWAAIYESVWK